MNNNKREVEITFSECPNCGNDVLIVKTKSFYNDKFYDGDTVICSECNTQGYFSVNIDDNIGTVNWFDF